MKETTTPDGMQLSAAIVHFAGLSFPPEHAWAAPYIRHCVWTTHAQLLCTLGRFAEAEEAIATAYEAFRHVDRRSVRAGQSRLRAGAVSPAPRAAAMGSSSSARSRSVTVGT